MTARVLARAQLPQVVPSLFAGRHLLILVPTTDAQWAAEAAWEFARAAATGERSVLLVDLSLEAPALDAAATRRLPRGIVDAFATDAPLSDVAGEQDRPGLHYISRGTPTPDPSSVWSSPRWRRLARGFASEGALLILFAPPAALAALDLDPDGMVVLAPDGYDATGGMFPKIAERLARGTSLLAVVASQVAVPRRSVRAIRPPRPGRSRAYAVVAGLGVVALVTTFALWSRRAGSEPAHGNAGAALPPARPTLPNAALGDSLYYSVQVAAYNTMAQAMEHAGQLEGEGRLAIVTPVRLGNQGVWHRVLVGVHQTARAADSALEELWRLRLLERPQGTILRTPETYRVKTARTRERAEDDVRGLREKGIPAYIVQAPDGTALVYVGAFDLPEQARTADSLLAAAGVAGTLVQRVGTTP